MDAYELIQTASKRLNDEITFSSGVVDTEGTRITSSDWIEYINNAQRQIVLVRPDSNYTITTLQLSAGAKQTLPAAGLALIRVYKNMGSDGATSGDGITVVDYDAFTEADIDWQNATAATAIEHYMYSSKTPLNFWVYPPAHAVTAVYVQLSYGIEPTAITATTGTLDHKDEFFGPMLDWILYEAFSIDTDSTANYERSIHHFNSFRTFAQVELEMQGQISPNVKA